MIAAEEVMPLVLAACPSFAAVWDPGENVDGTGRILYLDVMELVLHVEERLEAGDHSELVAVFDLIERLHIEGDPFVRELATIGFLEGFHPAADVVPWLLPDSLRWWKRLDRFWSGDVTALSYGAPD